MLLKLLSTHCAYNLLLTLLLAAESVQTANILILNHWDRQQAAAIKQDALSCKPARFDAICQEVAELSHISGCANPADRVD